MGNRNKKPGKHNQSSIDISAPPDTTANLSRRSYLAYLTTLSSAMVLPSSYANDTSDNVSSPEALDFGFIRQPPGEMYSLETHRLHSWSLGEGNCTVVLEPGLGGSTLEWLPMAEKLGKEAQVLLYDRAGYGWSDPGINPRHVLRLASELKSLLEIRSINGPLILAGHSYGGLIMREFARIADNPIKGLVLVDSSHEDQFIRLADEDGVSMLPTSDHFVVSAPELPTGLRDDVRRKILAFSKMRKSYAALHAELSSFKVSCDYIREQNHRFNFPVTVLSRGLDPSQSSENNKEIESGKGNNKEAIWQELQSDLLNLSEQSVQRIAAMSGHHIHIDQPQVVIDAIMDLTK